MAVAVVEAERRLIKIRSMRGDRLISCFRLESQPWLALGTRFEDQRIGVGNQKDFAIRDLGSFVLFLFFLFYFSDFSCFLLISN